MTEQLALDLAHRFAQVAALSLVEEFGFDGARTQVASLLADADDDTREMFEDIVAALDAMERVSRRAS